METIYKVLILGSGAIKIAEAAEFDYSGSQALKALREEGIETILVNPNIATIQTSYELADKVYLLPLKLEFVEKVIEKERPDGILLGFGGQTALSLGVKLHDYGILDRYGVKVLGTPIDGIRKALDRELFKQTMRENGLPIPPSVAARTEEEAINAAKEIGFPVIVRVSFNLGGRGSFIANNMEEFKLMLRRAFAHSEVRKVLVEKYLKHWKEIEFEVVRDAYGNSVAVACLENVDPMGVHTGDSIVVAPCQTLTNREYHLLRIASIDVARAINLIGECNVQLALDYNSEKFYIIETNPRMSRSSALASKATGYPLAYIAAKLALGYRLSELINRVTGRTTACFEPSLDYVVVKVPRWDAEKFGIEIKLDSEMKSIGEVMAIGRNLHEAFQKSIRMLDIGELGIVGKYYFEEESVELIRRKLKERRPYVLLHMAKALKLGLTPDEIWELTGIDKYFIYIIQEIVEIAEKLRKNPNDEELIREAKKLGFSDEQIELLTGREVRRKLPFVKQIDTLAAEWPASTNYLYVTHDASENDVKPSKRRKIMILGAGTFRIGVSVEFDWAVVSFANAARRLGYEVIVVNYNPETVSTDWDINDRLYFEEITLERVLDIYNFEKPEGIIAFAGGQLSNNLAKKLEESGVRILGTSGKSVDIAEDRSKFSRLLDSLVIKQPPWVEARSVSDIMKFIDEYGFPVIIRASYVLSGTAMKIARNYDELFSYLRRAIRISSEHPVIISKFIPGMELELDAVSDGKRIIGVLIEHIEPAGIHSGDATMVTPMRRASWASKRMKEIAEMLVNELEVIGPFNIQFVAYEEDIYVIEMNLRTSRSMPFSSKAKGVNLMDLAAKAVLKGKIDGYPEGFNELNSPNYAVKVAQFSWAQMKGAYPRLGPEMRSTGEVAALASRFEDALLKAWLAAEPNRMPKNNILIYGRERRKELEQAARILRKFFDVYTLERAEILGEVLSVDEAINLLKKWNIDLLITTGSMPEIDFHVRRTAVDMNIPVILNASLGLEIAKAFSLIREEGFEIFEMRDYYNGSFSNREKRKLLFAKKILKREFKLDFNYS